MGGAAGWFLSEQWVLLLATGCLAAPVLAEPSIFCPSGQLCLAEFEARV